MRDSLRKPKIASPRLMEQPPILKAVQNPIQWLTEPRQEGLSLKLKTKKELKDVNQPREPQRETVRVSIEGLDVA